MATTAAGDAAITKPVIQLMKDVIREEDDSQILHTDLRSMDGLLEYIDIFFLNQQKELPEIIKIWLQLLQNSLAETNGLFKRSGQRQSCLDRVVCNPRRLSKEIREWKAFFYHLYQGFLSDLCLHISTDAIISQVIDLVIELLKNVIEEQHSRPILPTDLRRMETLLQDITLFREKPLLQDITTLFQPLKLLQKSISEARYYPVVCGSWRLSKERREWSASFGKIYDGFQSDLSILVTSLQFLSSNPLLHKDEALLQEEAAAALVGSGITDAQAQVERWLNEGDPRVHVIGVYGLPGVGKTSLLRMLYNKYRYQVSNPVFEEVIWVTVSEYHEIFDLQSAIGHQIDDLSSDSSDSLDVRKIAYLTEKNFLLVLDGLWSRLDLQEVGVAFGDNKHLKVLFSTRRKNLIAEMSADESTEIQPLSKEEGWMLFRRLAFKDDQVVSMDIEERARKIADQCRGRPLAIHVVAAAMIGQSSVEKYWDNCLSSIQNVDPSFPATDSGLDAELYAALRFSYDALPNSEVKKCFLYCALYEEEQEIDTLELLQMWIGEGLVKSKQGTYLMDMAVGRKYLQLLVDRRLFHTVKEGTNVFYKQKTIRIQSVIRAMAIYIGQKEEKCLFTASDIYQRNFSEVPDENCRRISLANNFIPDLPTQFQCPQLASLILKGNRNLKELPSELLLSLTSLRVLNLSGCTQISSVPTSIDKLRMLEFLSLSELPIEELPKQICRLSQLQFLDLSGCESLKSLPSEIVEIQNLKCLNLDGCDLELIPREISELTSLSRLVLWRDLSMETEAAASIWRLKGLKNMSELSVWMGKGQQVKDGIMGTWSEMRHLKLSYSGSEEDLPEDMKSMKKLQSFMLYQYEGSHCLPNCCKFEHLEMVSLVSCWNIRELSPLEWMPNLKLLKLKHCNGLRELGIGSRGGYQRLQKLVLRGLDKLESLGGASKTEEGEEGVWDERTLPHLRVLNIIKCNSLQRFPKGMEKLPNLCAIIGEASWWTRVKCEDENIKFKLQNLFKRYSKWSPSAR